MQFDFSNCYSLLIGTCLSVAVSATAWGEDPFQSAPGPESKPVVRQHKPPYVATRPPAQSREPPEEEDSPPLATTAPPAGPKSPPGSTDSIPPPVAGPQPSAPAPAEAQNPNPPNPLLLGQTCRTLPMGGVSTGSGALGIMYVVNNGRRCGWHLHMDGRPYQGVALVTPPEHGTVALEASAFYYTPSAGYTGRDGFKVATTPIGSIIVKVTVLQ